MSREQLLSERLDAFLAARGTTRDALVAAIDEPFGPPLVVVAAGSVLHGFGNERSDVDILIVVDREVSRLPISSYAQQVLVDTKYFSDAEVKSFVRAIRDQPWPPRGRLDRDQWERHQARVINCARFAHGLVLARQESWTAWLETIRGGWLAERVANWWRIESIRRETAARWLADSKPLLAAVRMFEAVLAALESRAAAAGQLHYGPKWLSEKLRRLDDACALDALRGAMRVPANDRLAPAYIAQCQAVLDRVRSPDAAGMAAQMWYMPGVQVHALDGHALVTRWNLRAIETAPGTPRVPSPREPIWEGAIDGPPPPHLHTLFVEGMTWLSVVGNPA